MQKLPLLFATGAAILGCGLSACGPPPEPPVTGERTALRECPHTWEFPEEMVREQQILENLTRDKVHVPEYNDCQRFIVGNANSLGYDSLYAIFAVQLDSLVYRAAQYGREGITAAIIYAEGLYPRLGIQPGFNCLVMRGDPEREAWQAAMKPVGSLTECEGPVPMPDGPPLEVHRRVVEGISGGEHYPPVARWGFDETTLGLHYMILKCGDAMCSIGPPGFERRLTPDSLVASGASARERRVVTVAGWHDEQRLALPDGAGGLVPSDTWGVVIPDPDLGELNDDADFRDHWVLVARAAMSTDAYRSKLGFEKTTAGALNEVWACVGRCTGAGSLACADADNHSGDRWRTMHISATSRDTTYHCVRRYDAGEEAEVPAAARWRWQAVDETVWFRCKQGCCDVVE